MKTKKLFNIFVLKCVTCGAKVQRKSEDCKEQPFCDNCYAPMTLDAVFLNSRVFPRKNV
jgi:NAD-dependent SIR2 family protein deacetylase